MWMTSRGGLDPSFDADGRVTTVTGPAAATDTALAVAAQPDGKIITAGFCNMGATGADACLASYDQGGRFSDFASGPKSQPPRQQAPRPRKPTSDSACAPASAHRVAAPRQAPTVPANALAHQGNVFVAAAGSRGGCVSRSESSSW